MIVAILSMTSMHSIYQTTHEEGLYACIADNHRNECCQSKQSLSLLLRLSHAIEFDPDGKVTKAVVQYCTTYVHPDTDRVRTVYKAALNLHVVCFHLSLMHGTRNKQMVHEVHSRLIRLNRRPISSPSVAHHWWSRPWYRRCYGCFHSNGHCRLA